MVQSSKLLQLRYLNTSLSRQLEPRVSCRSAEFKEAVIYRRDNVAFKAYVLICSPLRYFTKTENFRLVPRQIRYFLIGSNEILQRCSLSCRGLGIDDPSSPDLEFGLASSLNPDDLSSLVPIASTTLL